jgi:transposase
VALEAVRLIDMLFDIQRGINGLAANERLRIRKERSAPVLDELERWLRQQRSRMSRSASVAEPIDHVLKRWNRFTRFIEDGSICLTNKRLSAPCADLHWDANRGSLPAQSAAPSARPSWLH